MSFEKFKKAIKGMSIDDMNREIQERKKLLFKWNRPLERRVEVGAYNPQTKMADVKSLHPFKKVRKELAILNTIVHQKMNKKKETKQSRGSEPALP